MKTKTKSALTDILVGALLLAVAILALEKFAFNIAILIIAIAALIAGILRGTDASSDILKKALLTNIFFYPVLLLAMNVWHLALIPIVSAGGIFSGLYVKLHWRSSFIKMLGILSLYISIILLTTFIGIPKLFEVMSTTEVHLPAPEYEFLSPEGKSLKSDELKGKLVVLDFWGIWCAPCIKQFPLLEEINKKYKSDTNVVLIAVNTNLGGDTFEKFNDFILKNPYELTFAYDIESKATKEFKIRSFPTLILIDKKGVIRLKHKGFNESEHFRANIEKYIDALLREE